MHQALYRKWRPKTFDDVCGQDHITSILKHQVAHGQLSHAYLFCGSRGTGKTTCAKILARAVNCTQPVNGNPCGVCPACMAIEAGRTADVLEMDAASNNGVDDIRDIRDEVVYAPSDVAYRVYIIDEVHMLSSSAFNALLKTLEEPPAHILFILATTELHKLPATIVSRCQRYDFRRLSTQVLSARLHYIAEREGLTLEADAARMIARYAQGGMRDAISLLELCAGSSSSITGPLVEQTVGATGRGALAQVVRALADQVYDPLFEAVDRVVRSSGDLLVFWQDLLSLYRDMLVTKTLGHADEYLDLTDAEGEEVRALAARFSRATLLAHIHRLDEAYFAMQKAQAVKRIVAELTLVRLCDPSLDVSNEAMLSRIARLEEQIALGCTSASPLATPQEAEEANQAPIGEQKRSRPDASRAISSGDAPHARPAVAAEPSGTQPAEQPVPGRRTLRPLRCWQEVVERVRTNHPMEASFLKQAKAYSTEDGSVVLKFPGAFECSMAFGSGNSAGNGDRADTALCAALSVCLGRPVPVDRVIREVDEAGDRPADGIDLILDALSPEAFQ